MTLRSAAFDDIYFSPEDGLAETMHVFIENNGLPGRWRAQDGGRPGDARFVIAETGFGTGLNFLATWTLFEETAAPGRLDFISFEKFPLAGDEAHAAVARWDGLFGGRRDRLRALYPLRVPGFHRVTLTDRVTLTLVFDDVNMALPQLDVPGGVDAWFLDGFAPAKNPDMWSDAVFAQMARLSRTGASFATFTAAGAVKRGLEAAGFTVEKRRGYGRKRDMLAGSYQGEKAGFSPSPSPSPSPLPARGPVAVIGAGLAGTAAAYALRRAGRDCVIFEAGDGIASGASGNPAGLYNPRLSAQRSADSDFYVAAWAQAARVLPEIQATADIGFRRCGSLHLSTDPAKEKKLRGAAARWGWHPDHMAYCEGGEAAARCGLPVKGGGLFLPDAGAVSPAALCAAWARGAEVRPGAYITGLTRHGDGWRVAGMDFSAVILACGAGARRLAGLDWLPLHTVRGQMSVVRTNDALRGLRASLCYGGYLSPAAGGLHALGATFQRGDEGTELRDEDHAANIERLRAVLPGAGMPEVCGGRAALRTASHDRLPLAGAVPDRAAWAAGGAAALPGLYISSGHGSHGIVSSLAAASLLADMITGAPRGLSRESVACVDPARFLRRARRRGGG